jgi:hypothetical protein
MGRIRTVKPQLFIHQDLYLIEQKYQVPVRLAWIGLFTVADREGRFKWRPHELKVQILPYDNLNFEIILNALEEIRIIKRYKVDGETFGVIIKWSEHQSINQREAKSALPPPELDSGEKSVCTCVHMRAHGEGKGKERKEICTNVNENEQTDLNQTTLGSDSSNLSPCEKVFLTSQKELIRKLATEIKPEVQKGWLERYGDRDWIETQMLDAMNWMYANPNRQKKNIARFLNNWLARSSERGQIAKEVPLNASNGVYRTAPARKITLEDIKKGNF